MALGLTSNGLWPLQGSSIEALECLVADGYVSVSRGDRGDLMYESVKPFRELDADGDDSEN